MDHYNIAGKTGYIYSSGHLILPQVLKEFHIVNYLLLKSLFLKIHVYLHDLKIVIRYIFFFYFIHMDLRNFHFSFLSLQKFGPLFLFTII